MERDELRAMLERTVAGLERGIEARRVRFYAERDRGVWLPTAEPEDITDANGRPLLLDAYGHLALALSALASLGTS